MEFEFFEWSRVNLEVSIDLYNKTTLSSWLLYLAIYTLIYQHQMLG